MLFENIKIALSSMRHNKLRTLLSLLGIIIGVGSVVAILNLGQSVQNSITESMNIGGLELITIYPTGSSRKTNLFDESFGQELMKNVIGLDYCLPVASSNARVRKGQEIKTVQVNGVNSGFFEVNRTELLYGDYFSAMDNINRRQVVVLGHDLAEDLFPAGDAVGSYVSIFRNQSKSYLVVGVLDKQEETLGTSFDSSAYIPFNTYDQRFRSVTTVSSFTCHVMEGFNATEVADEIEEYLDKMVGEDYFNIFSAASMVKMAGEVTKTLSSFLAAIAAISLLVGGIGIMNIMLVSVAERTREIGIRKALGASPRVIRGQFLCEAVTITLIGGVLGIAVGALVSYAIVEMVGWTLHFSYAAVAISIGFSMFVGVFFGWYPAIKASRLDPIEALSYE
ncbi:MAG: ABC transporter permease [Spirochaetales bacterium]|nr:ABC transporter permease [Spirochaetales bacterium]